MKNKAIFIINSFIQGFLAGFLLLCALLIIAMHIGIIGAGPRVWEHLVLKTGGVFLLIYGLILSYGLVSDIRKHIQNQANQRIKADEK